MYRIAAYLTDCMGECLALSCFTGFTLISIDVCYRDGSASMTYSLRPTVNNPETVIQDEDDFFHRHHSITEEWRRYERQEPEDDYNIRNKQV